MKGCHRGQDGIDVVVEFGLVGRTMHKVDECVPVEQVRQLKSVYTRILRDYFA